MLGDDIYGMIWITRGAIIFISILILWKFVSIIRDWTADYSRKDMMVIVSSYIPFIIIILPLFYILNDILRSANDVSDLAISIKAFDLLIVDFSMYVAAFIIVWSIIYIFILMAHEEDGI